MSQQAGRHKQHYCLLHAAAGTPSPNITEFGISSLVDLLSNDLGLRLGILCNVLANGADLPRHLLRSRLHTLCKGLQGNRTASLGAVLKGGHADHPPHSKTLSGVARSSHL